MMGTKSVFLKCRFGDHLPSDHKAVELATESADYLISEGLAVEASLEESIGSGDGALKAELTRLTCELETAKSEAQAEVTRLNEALTVLQAEVARLTEANAKLVLTATPKGK